MRHVHFEFAGREALKKATCWGEVERRRLPMALCFLVCHIPLHNYRHGITIYPNYFVASYYRVNEQINRCR